MPGMQTPEVEDILTLIAGMDKGTEIQGHCHRGIEPTMLFKGYNYSYYVYTICTHACLVGDV